MGPTRSPPTSSSTPLPTTTPAPTSRLPRLTTAPPPGLDLTLSPSLTWAPSTSPTLPTTSMDTSPLSPTTARLSTPRLSPLPTLLPTPSPLPVPSTMLIPWSMPLLWTVELYKCPTSQCPSLTRASTGPPPSPRPSAPPSPLSTTPPAPSTELTAGGYLPLLDTELSSVKKLHQQPFRRPSQTTENLTDLLTNQSKIDKIDDSFEFLSCDIHQVIYSHNLFCGKYTLLLK